jgi:hypothetical protein
MDSMLVFMPTIFILKNIHTDVEKSPARHTKLSRVLSPRSRLQKRIWLAVFL